MTSTVAATIFTVDHSGRHHVIVSDKHGWPTASRFLRSLAESGASRQCVRPSQANQTQTLRTLLSEQPMGVRLYIAGGTDFVSKVCRTAKDLGYGPDELQVIRFGPAAPNVFCLGCYHLFPHPGTAVTSCPNCGRDLELTSHVSVRLDAVMGCLALPKGVSSNHD